MQLAIGSDADSLLTSPQFVKAWRRLWRQCPWATVFQAPSFARIWYDVYSSKYRPIVILEKENNHLTGLLLLASSCDDSQLFPVGTHHAEYDAWLATADNAETFIIRALSLCASELGSSKRLSFHFLAPNAPISWTDRIDDKRFAVSLHPQERPLITLDDVTSVQNSLSKRGNRSKLNRLASEGPLQLRRLRTREATEKVFEDIISFTEVRQGAVNDTLPFTADPLKEELYLTLSQRPDMLHVSILQTGDKIVAGHLGPVTGDQVILGLFTHNPAFAADSPGKLMIYKLALFLAEEGYDTFDLTPGGAFKHRRANHSDRIWTLRVYLTESEILRYRAKRRTKRIGERIFDLAGLQPRRISRALTDGRHALSGAQPSWLRTVIQDGVKVARRRVRNWNGRQEKIFALSPSQVNQYRVQTLCNGAETEVTRNNIQDIAAFRHNDVSRSDKYQFFSEAYSRLEDGEQAYTAVRNGELIHCSWLRPECSDLASDCEQKCEQSSRVAVLQSSDSINLPPVEEVFIISVAMRVRDALRFEDLEEVLLVLNGKYHNRENSIQEMGFSPIDRKARAASEM